MCIIFIYFSVLDAHSACTCPGCPFSSSPPFFETLTARQPVSSSPYLQASCQPEDLSLSMCPPDTTVPSSSSSSSGATSDSSPSGRPRRDYADDGARSRTQSSGAAPLKTPLSHLSVIPCLCCQRSLQSCTQLLGNQQGRDLPFAHTHHHFHHHHCPLTSCVPCPQLSRSAQLSGPFPCLPCQCSFPACPQVCQHRRAPQQDGKSRTLLSPHPCMHCAATFSRPSQLLQHQRLEHAHKPPGFQCTECGRAFNSHSNLRIHLNVHTGARPYSCADCGKSFSQSGALKIHRRIHTGERPYSCGFCGRGFPHLAGVRAHQRTHTGEKPYSCSQCGKCFTQSGALKVHTRIHTGERPFTCSICEKGFSNRSGIRFHYRTVHGLTPEHDGEGGAAGGAYPGPSGYSPGRPRTVNVKNGPDSRAAPDPASELISADREHDRKSQGGAASREGLPYACEDCGLRFKDAPSRNRHQTLAHYSHEGRQEEEEGQRKEFSTSEEVHNQSL